MLDRPEKMISWSYSKITNYELCPRKHYECQIQKNFKESSDALDEGRKVHEALEHALKGTKPLPPSMQKYEKWLDRIRSVPGELLVECKYALNRDLQPVDFKDWDGAWYRGIADAVVLSTDHPGAALAWDWKTGKRRNVDEVQLALMAWCIVTHYPKVERVVTSFIYLPDDSEVTEIYDRSTLLEMWNDLMPRVNAYVNAVRTQQFPPKPGFLCAKHCPVNSCPHHGKR